ncbi:acyl-CoA dehydrogenase family protein [Sulfitobacter sp. F26169L]|uniref:acyl-CoA dehydrogenase family protein n=1 Tax=Sulfitobacter sp. F26169L TaxID=2996015 RepID=UPI002260A15D|nr:acyl-CoA dehydrogenase family protein [Sulfitobacter sp. F26169L]MCX7568079.1 acyl-CoA dehydrogenase family protein [Sulfitobacter sp. F26169L]
MSDTTKMLDDALNTLLERRLADAMARNSADLPETLMGEMIESGFTRVLASEADGGLDGTLADAACVAWRCGWHGAPVPIVEMLLLAHLDPHADAAQVSVAHGSPAIAPLMQGTQSIRTGRETLAADTGKPFTSIADAPWCVLENTDAGHDDDTLVMGALLSTAAMTGAMARTLDIMVDHVETRTQFGRPLKKFQAIQHQLAEAASELTITEAALASALEAFETADSRVLLWASAKAQAGVAATKVAATAHQLAGAIGFTEEHALHHFTKKLWHWRDTWGRQADCEIAIGRAACAAPNGLWPYIADTEGNHA